MWEDETVSGFHDDYLPPIGVYASDNFDDAALLEEDPSVADARKRLMSAGVGLVASLDNLKPLQFANAAALFTKEFPPTSWLVRGLMTPNSVYAIAGEAKTSKTWAALEMAMAVATGTKAFGEFQTGEPQNVVYFAAEDNERSLRNRLRALAASRKMDPAEACQNIHVMSMAALNVTSPHDLARLVAGIEAIEPKPVLLTLDPLRDLHSEEENDSTAMAKVTHALRAVRTTLGSACTFVHHSSKHSETTKSRRPGQRMRGSGVLHGAVDGGLYLYDLKQEEDDDTDESRWKNTAFGEVKGAKQAGEFGLELIVEDDDDGEAISAKWVVTKGGVKGQEIRSEVLQYLRNQPDGDWVSAARVQKDLKKKRATVISALHDLHREQLIEKSLARGPKSGWRSASVPTVPIRSGNGDQSVPPPLGGNGFRSPENVLSDGNGSDGWGDE